MDEEFYFTVDGIEWQQQSYNESEDHPATEDVKFIRKTKFPAKVLLWLSLEAPQFHLNFPLFLKLKFSISLSKPRVPTYDFFS
jgi:hypothetical protein